MSVLALCILARVTIDHSTLVLCVHAEFGFTYTVLQRFSSYMTDRTHYISLSNHCSALAPVHSGVPQSLVLGPMLFTMYIKPRLLLLTHTLSCTIHLLMTYNYICLLPLLNIRPTSLHAGIHR